MHELSLRAMEPEDADFMYDAESDPAAWRYSDYLAPISREMLRHYALTYDADPYRSGQLRLIIENGEKPIGILDLFDISARHLRAETGIYLLPESRGNASGTRALQAAKEYCRERLGLHQLSATIGITNEAAISCFGKAGFIRTGMRPDWLRMADRYEDTMIFTVLL